jgi:hypothetical protein
MRNFTHFEAAFVILFALALLVPLGAAESGEGGAASLEIFLETLPEIPEVQVPWRVLVLVNHPVPSEVLIRAPEFPPSLGLESIRIGIRYDTDSAAYWTVVEYLFIPREGGPLTLGSFEVEAPGGRGLSPALNLRVRGGVSRNRMPHLVWEAPPALRVGEGAILTLRLLDGDPETPLPRSFRPDLPANGVLEALSPAGEELRFRVIPLEGPSLTLKAAALSYGGRSLPVPPLEIPVLPAAVTNTILAEAAGMAAVPAGGPGADPAGGRLTGAPAEIDPGAAFPPFQETAGVFFPLRREYREAAEAARELWNQGRRAEALALLRAREGDLLAGPALVRLRQAAEAAEGIAFTENEHWLPWALFPALGLGGFLGLIITGLVFFVPRRGEKNSAVTSGPSWGYRGIIILWTLLIGIGIYGYARNLLRGSRVDRARSGVLRSAGAYRVPEAAGEADLWFREGTPVRIRSVAGDWAYVETFDGRAGWVSAGLIIPY